MTVASWVQEAVVNFGRASKEKLAGPGDREAAIRSPLEALLNSAGDQLRVKAVFHDEVRDHQRQVRPDYGVSVSGLMSGYVEVKAPGKGIDPAGFKGHNRRQWERQRDLPNLMYTNGTEWRLYRDGELHRGPVYLTGGTLDDAGAGLEASPEFEALLTDFLRWKPAPITSVGALVRSLAPLTRLLRGEVIDQLTAEKSAIQGGEPEWQQPFVGLARDWRNLLFPTADDDTFADGYAQTVTFALLLARTENITLTETTLHEIGSQLSAEHSLMGKALQLLTNDVAADFKVTLDLLVRLVDSVQWDRIHQGRRDTYLHLYEHFLEEYDNELRKQSGSYYTPREVVHEMVRLCEEVLSSRLDKPRGFEDPDVYTVDPAMGTGTYLHTILERIAERTAVIDGPGAVPGIVAQAASRLAGFELQMGPYAVAELRAANLLSSHGAQTPKDGLNLYVTDTLDDPTAAETQIGSGLQLIAQSRRRANEIKANTNVTVVIGNPPYRERAQGMGGWVESGSGEHGPDARPILDDFRYPGNGKYERHLKNLHAYFWRWATWKVWESTPGPDTEEAGIVCFITTSGYLASPGFKGMRKYLREHASEGWIIDLTPEGQTPDIPTRIFPGVRQPLAIGLFLRKPDTSTDDPATVHYRALHGRQAEKYNALRNVQLDNGWQETRTEWTAPFTAAGRDGWDDYPALGDLMPWVGPGIKASRTWIYAPTKKLLERRWNAVTTEQDPSKKRELFKESPGVSLDRERDPLPGKGTHQFVGPFDRENGNAPDPVRVAYRAFDRQWVIPDARLMQRPGPFWPARLTNQVFTIEQHSVTIYDGPGLLFSNHIPDLNHFKGSEGGRALPLLHTNGKANTTPGLLEALSDVLGLEINHEQLLAYIAGTVAHPAYTATFADQLMTPGIRVPITKDPELFQSIVQVGEQVIWLHTYGETYSGPDRPHGNIRYASGDARQPLAQTAITDMPEGVDYDAEAEQVVLGEGRFGPVQPQVWDYTVGGRPVVKSWVAQRKKDPGGMKKSPLDRIHTGTWDPDWTREFIDLLTVLTRIVDLEDDQAALLAEILEQPTITTDELSEQGVRWPQDKKDRSPDSAPTSPTLALQIPHF